MTKPHLGGHYDSSTMPITTFDFIVSKFNIKSAIDIGCGPGGMTRYGNYKGIPMIGIDGDTDIPAQNYIIFHDYTEGPVAVENKFDLAWSTEFLEHVYADFIPNFLQEFN